MNTDRREVNNRVNNCFVNQTDIDLIKKAAVKAEAAAVHVQPEPRSLPRVQSCSAANRPVMLASSGVGDVIWVFGLAPPAHAHGGRPPCTRRQLEGGTGRRPWSPSYTQCPQTGHQTAQPGTHRIDTVSVSIL